MKWIWADDGWTTTCSMPDKLEHFNAGFMGTITLLILFNAWWVIPIALVAAVLWEVKDAFINPWNIDAIPYKDNFQELRVKLLTKGDPDQKAKAEVFFTRMVFPWHWLLGDGFSWRDMVASWAGVLAAWGLAHIGGVI